MNPNEKREWFIVWERSDIDDIRLEDGSRMRLTESEARAMAESFQRREAYTLHPCPTEREKAVLSLFDEVTGPALNRRAAVEDELGRAAKGKAPLPDREACRRMARALGIPAEWLSLVCR